MIDLNLLAAIIHDKEPGFLFFDSLEQAIDSDVRHVYSFIRDFHKNHSKLPAFETIQKETSLNLAEWVTGEPADFYAQKVRDRHLHRIWDDASSRISAALSSDRNKGGRTAIQIAEDILTTSRLIDATEATATSMDSEERRAYRKDQYALKEKGLLEKGIQTPWPILNEACLGFFPGDLAAIIGRTGVGKTFFMMMLAAKACEDGHTALFGSLEMGRDPLEIRGDAIRTKLAHRDLRRGDLGDFEKEWYFDYLDNTKYDGDLIIVEPSGVQSVSALEAAVESAKPDIVFLDSFYKMLSDTGKSVWERVATLVWDLKMLADRRQIPIVVSSQFGRQVKKGTRGGRGGDPQDVAFAYALSQDTDIMLSVNQDDELEDIGAMFIRTLKLRNDETIEFHINWDLDAGMFDYVELSELIGYDED